MPLDVFLSHSSGDADVARELRGILEAAGYRCWMAPDDVTGTESWAEQILAAIEASRSMIVLISSNANKSPHVSREVNLALGRRRAVLPVRIENVPTEASLEYLLSLMQRIDAFPLPISDHRDRILRRLAAVVSVSEAPAHETTTEGAAGTQAPPVAGPGPESGADAAPAPAGIGPGSTIGGFAIDTVLGEGGMATVYRAIQQEPKRSVALKLIRADHAADPTYRKRFLSEKDTLASLEHPSIVPIYAAGDADGVLFIAMRLVDGPDLAAKLARVGRLSLPETIATLRPIAEAIDYAHEMGVVHRDLKPSNVILDRHGRPYLTDFGLGKHIEGQRDLSAPGIAIGTLDYMAPEQFTGTLDPALVGRTDVYALGCMAFTCLTGAPPFRATEPERVMYGHLHGEVPSVRDVRPDLPPAVDTAIRRALAKDPADRYATAEALLQALSVAGSTSDEQTAMIVPPRVSSSGGIGAWIRTHAVVATAAAAGVAMVAVGAAVLAVGGANPTRSASPGAPGTITAGGGSSGPSANPTVVPSGPSPQPSPETSDGSTPTPTVPPSPTASIGPTPSPFKPTPRPTATPINDTIKPTLSGPPEFTFAGGIQSPDGYSAKLNVTWSGSDKGGSGLKEYVLEHRKSDTSGSGSWTEVYRGSATSRVVTVATRVNNVRAFEAFRVTAIDKAGNRSTTATGDEFILYDYQESYGSWTFVGGWTDHSEAGALEDTVKLCSTSGSTASLMIPDAWQLAFVFTANTGGSVRISVDGVDYGPYSLSGGGVRTIVKTVAFPSPRPYNVPVVITTLSDSPVHFDAILAVRRF